MKKFKSDYYSMAQSDYCCYLSDITVADKVQHRGIGKELIRLASRQLSDKCQLILSLITFRQLLLSKTWLY